MGALNAFPFKVRLDTRKIGNFVASSRATAARRTRRTDAFDREEIELEFDTLIDTELQGIRAIVAAVKFSGSIDFTPVGEASDRKFRVEEYTEMGKSNNTFGASMLLVFLPGI